MSRCHPRRSRRIRLLAEPLEPRRLLAADLGAATRQLAWNGEIVTAVADAWIVTGSRQSLEAPRVQPGWSVRPLGEGMFAVSAPGASTAEMVSWADAGGFSGLEPDLIVTSAALPNDPSFSSLWGLDNSGQTGGVADADIDAPEAWDVTTGSRSVVVAVVDTGIDYRHQDLAANMWRNPGEIAGDRIDNDGNGFIDDVYGWDFANNDADPFDDQGHGTHVAGTIGAVGNNGVGVAGVNWQVSLMALKFLGSDGSGTTSGAVAALNYATLMRRTYGVNVVVTNNSWGGGGPSTALTNAIVAGGDAGILCVAAAGNSATDNDETPSFPANVASTAVIAVAATDASNRLASFSNYGATTVDVAAPGVSVRSTTPNNGYATYSGTSMASPHVAGVVALMAAANPQASASQIRSAILSSAVPVSALAGRVASGGLVNAAAAVAAIGGAPPGPPQPPPPPPPPAVGEPNDSLATALVVSLAGGQASVSGTIGDGSYAAADVDLYAVTVAAGSVLTVDIDAESLGGGSLLDSYVRIFNAGGTQLAFNDDSGGSLDSLVSYTVAASGTYYVGVSSYGNTAYAAATAGSGVPGESTGSYTVRVVVTQPNVTADIVDVAPDPRTTSVSAVVVQFSQAVTGVDVGDFRLTRGGSNVSMRGVLVTTTDNVRWTLTGLDAATATAGTYVLSLNATGSGIVALAGGAALVASVSDTWVTQAAVLVDAGDTLATAAALGITSGSVRLSGRIGDGSFGSRDVDMYSVALAAGQSLTVDIDARTLSGGSTLDSVVRVFSPSGAQVAFNDDDGATLDSRLTYRAVTAGTYFVGVSGYRNSAYVPTRGGSGTIGSTGVYQVAFSLTSAAGAGVRTAGFRDGMGRQLTTSEAAFMMYGGNWAAALPAAPSRSSPLSRRG